MEALELILNCTISSARARMNSSSLASSAPASASAPAPRLAWSSTLSLASRLNTNPYSRFSSNSRTKCFNLQIKISIHHISKLSSTHLNMDSFWLMVMTVLTKLS